MAFNLTRFLGVVGRLGSSFDGERATAAALATKMLREAGLTWADVVQPPQPEQPEPRPAPRHYDNGRDLVDDLLLIVDELPFARADFVRGCHAQKSALSFKQVQVLLDIHGQYFGQRARA